MTANPDPDAPSDAGSGKNVLVAWLRSRAGVAERWWADVLARCA